MDGQGVSDDQADLVEAADARREADELRVRDGDAVRVHMSLPTWDEVHGKPDVYAHDGEEEFSRWVGPFSNVDQALAEYLDEHEPEDDEVVVVCRGKPMALPEVDAADRLMDMVLDDLGEQAYDSASLGAQERDALNGVVNAAIRAWYAEHRPEALKGFWTTEGAKGRFETTGREGRRLIACATARRCPHHSECLCPCDKCPRCGQEHEPVRAEARP